MIKVTVPTSWEDVTVDQYQMLTTLDRGKYKTDLRYTIDLVSVLCNIDATTITLEALNDIAINLEFLQKEVECAKKDWVLIDSKKFEWVADFNSLSVGEVISIESCIDMEELSYNLSIDVVAAILLRPSNEKFNAKLFNERRKLYGGLPITELKGMVNFFSNGGRHSIQNIKDCLVIPMKMKKMKRVGLILYKGINGLVWLINLQSRILQNMKRFTNKIILQHSTC